MKQALVIGAGPAGLMAAEMLAGRGHAVRVAEAKPSVGRKFLMAGKSGLNLTKDEAFEPFLAQFSPSDPLRPALSGFSNQDVAAWARDLGQPVFTGSSGRIFPMAMKASPLLRAWLARLNSQNVRFQTRWRWTGWQDEACAFQTPEGVQTISPDVTVLALGGASWARLGSDGAWAGILARCGIATAPFQPANMGFRVDWSTHMTRFFGQPLKTCTLTAGDQSLRGECVLTAKGIEGGAIYSLSKPLREGAALSLDLVPDWTQQTVQARLARPRNKASLANHLRKTLNLDPLRLAVLQECARPLPETIPALAALLKNLPVPLRGPNPMDEAISTAGGIPFTALNDHLMLTAKPGLFAAGEMLDWEAPTGGYLITACLATGRLAGLGAAQYLETSGA